MNLTDHNLTKTFDVQKLHSHRRHFLSTIEWQILQAKNSSNLNCVSPVSKSLNSPIEFYFLEFSKYCNIIMYVNFLVWWGFETELIYLKVLPWIKGDFYSWEIYLYVLAHNSNRLLWCSVGTCLLYNLYRKLITSVVVVVGPQRGWVWNVPGSNYMSD
jgi:hypothetical protein